MKKITGTLVWYYFICKRQLWLMSREITPFEDDDLLELGRLISEESYRRSVKEINIENIKIDFLKKENNSIVVCEIKKSSKFLEAAKMQLLFYLYKLKQKGTKVKGELLIPREKKKIELKLTDEIETKIINTIKKIREIIKNPTPLPLIKTKFCNKCAYREFCWER